MSWKHQASLVHECSGRKFCYLCSDPAHASGADHPCRWPTRWRLVGDTNSMSLNGQEVCSTVGFHENRFPAQPYVDAWFSNPWGPAADVTVANLVYTSLCTRVARSDE